jgi:hypothetical protein
VTTSSGGGEGQPKTKLRREARVLSAEELTTGQKLALDRLRDWIEAFPGRQAEREAGDLRGVLFLAEERENNVFCISADRGLGKTSVLVTFLHDLRTKLGQTGSSGKPALVPLPTTDFDAMAPGGSVALGLLEPLFRLGDSLRAGKLSASVSGFVADASPWSDNEPESARLERQLLQALSHWFAGRQLVEHTKSPDEVVAFLRKREGGPTQLREIAFDYIDALVKEAQAARSEWKNPVFVASVDDADLVPNELQDLLIALRIFRHPRLAWVLAADLGRAEADLAQLLSKSASRHDELARRAVEKVVGERVELGLLAPSEREKILQRTAGGDGNMLKALASPISLFPALPGRPRALLSLLATVRLDSIVSDLARAAHLEMSGDEAKKSQYVIAALLQNRGPGETWDDLRAAGLNLHWTETIATAVAGPSWGEGEIESSRGLALSIRHGDGSPLQSYVAPLALRVLEDAARAGHPSAVATMTAIEGPGLQLVRYPERLPEAARDGAWSFVRYHPSELVALAASWNSLTRGLPDPPTLAQLFEAYVRALAGRPTWEGAAAELVSLLAERDQAAARRLLHPLYGIGYSECPELLDAVHSRPASDLELFEDGVSPELSPSLAIWSRATFADVIASDCGHPALRDEILGLGLSSVFARCLLPAPGTSRQSLSDYWVPALPVGDELGGAIRGDLLHFAPAEFAAAIARVGGRQFRGGGQSLWQRDRVGAWRALAEELDAAGEGDRWDVEASLAGAPALRVVRVPPEVVAKQSPKGGLEVLDIPKVSVTFFRARDFGGAWAFLETVFADWHQDRREQATMVPAGLWREDVEKLVLGASPRVGIELAASGRRFLLPMPEMASCAEAQLMQHLIALFISARAVEGGHSERGLWGAFLCSAWRAAYEALSADIKLPERSKLVPAAHQIDELRLFDSYSYSLADFHSLRHRKEIAWRNFAPMLLLPEFGLPPAVATAWRARWFPRSKSEARLDADDYRSLAAAFRARNGLPDSPGDDDVWQTFLTALPSTT